MHRCTRYGLTALLLFLLSALGQCTTPTGGLEGVPNKPASQVIDAPEPIVRQAVERVLQKKNFVLQPATDSPQQLQTDWLVDGRYRSKVIANFKSLAAGNKTSLTMQVFVQKKGLWEEEWKPQQKIRDRAYENLMADVVMETYRVIYESQ
ncbi:MAG: hypothetical protein JRI89_13485 [Deltaproteobacteria bacterium]|nr:hypothetical protein [Deltaproteobacteria bacterium]